MIRNKTILSETGLCRRNNQDAVFAVQQDGVGIFAVADGMGGHYRGELASQTTTALLKSWWEEVHNCVSAMSFLDVVAALEQKIKEINTDIFCTYKEMGQQGGTTLCLLLIHHNAYAVLNVGDSRLYRCQGWLCMQMTVDDVWENQASVRQTMKVKEIRKNPCCGKLVQSLGAQESLRISVLTGLLIKRTAFLLCSDGIYKYCNNSYLMLQLRRCLRSDDSVLIAERIKKMIYRNGAKDNLSMVLVVAEIEKEK